MRARVLRVRGVVVGERIATIIRFHTPSERRKRGDVLSTKAFPYVYGLVSGEAFTCSATVHPYPCSYPFLPWDLRDEDRELKEQ